MRGANTLTATASRPIERGKHNQNDCGTSPVTVTGTEKKTPMTETVSRQMLIVNEKGLHARAAAKLVEVAEGFDATAEVSHDGESSGADSIMGLLMLAASKGKTIDVRARGADAEALLDAIEALVADRFGEDM
jgi:phosphocarrier protein HPr